jgi:NADH-quinone oxidoreductase subunit N
MLAQTVAQAFHGPAINWTALSPLLTLLVGGLALMVGASLTPDWPKHCYALFTAAVALASMVLAIVLWHRISIHGPIGIVGDALHFDHFAMFFTITIGACVVLASLLTDDYQRREGNQGAEIYSLYLMSALGGIVMAASNDLIVLFLGLETLSIALYVLAAADRRRLESQEAGIKYFVLGGFSSAFLLYGISMLYGAFGTTRLSGSDAAPGIFEKLNSDTAGIVFLGHNKALLLAGIALVLVGLAFKVAAVPFHMWTPDVYQGSPTPVTAYMASAAKAAGFAAILRVLVDALANRTADWRPVIWVIAVATLLVGSILAVVQTNVKRMLAYSSISHAGYILVGIEAAGHQGGRDGVSAALFYLLAYAVLVLGTFAIVGLASGKGDADHHLDTYKGLGRSRPVLGLAMTVFLLAQAGVPLTSGFFAKFGVIGAAVNHRSYALAIIAMLASVIGAFLYLRILVSMYMAEGDSAAQPIQIPLFTGTAIAIAAGFTLAVGFQPSWLTTIARHAVPALRSMNP